MPKYGSRHGVWISDEHQEPPFLSSPSPFFRRGPQKLSGGSHKDGGCSAACSTFFFFTADTRRWCFHWQVSVQADTARTGRIAPWRVGWVGGGGGNGSVLFKSNDRYLPPLLPPPPPPPRPPLVRAPWLLPTGALRLEWIKKKKKKKKRKEEKKKKKKRALQGDEMRPSVSPRNETPSTSSTLSSLVWDVSGLVGDPGSQIQPGEGWCDFSSLAFGALPVVPPAPHPHAAQTVGATTGLEANKAKERRRTGPLLCSSWPWRGGAQNPERIACQGADWTPDANCDSPHWG